MYIHVLLVLQVVHVHVTCTRHNGPLSIIGTKGFTRRTQTAEAQLRDAKGILEVAASRVGFTGLQLGHPHIRIVLR